MGFVIFHICLLGWNLILTLLIKAESFLH
uniref:Uncharacterized protein n=1 Tax=Rhizophora mucronata TaxID=61149 RepID=A0A2P2P9F0_RHIMU